jgi:hypothetical protein
MLVLKTKSLFLAAAMLISILQGCGARTKISDINQDPGRYSNKDVTVAGTVTESFGALGTGAYQIDDGTGKIWIVSTQSGVPGKGTQVAATGRIFQGATIAGRSFGTAIRESHRKS